MSSTSGSSLRQFRRAALRVVAVTLAVGMVLLVVVLAVAVPSATTVDLTTILVGAVAHAVVGATVGRRWEPGGAVNVLYVSFLLLLVFVGISQALTPASDAPWFLLIPLTLTAITLSLRWQVVMAVVALVGFAAASAVGPGIDLSYLAQRGTALVIYAVGMGALTHRLGLALAAADAAQADLQADVADVTSVNVELQRVDSARDDYVSSVSHELRTPLTVILGMARTLDAKWDELDDDARRQLATRVAASAGGLEGIVSALLDLARIERGGVEPLVGPVDVGVAVTASVARLGPVLDRHEVVVAVDPDLVVATDARILERVLDNLLTNAARHTPAGSRVTVAAVAHDGRVRIAVADDGPGIAPEDVARLGEQFFRGGAHAGADRDGLGLGLSLVVELLRALGEELEVTSEVGRGTTFAFSLSRVSDETAAI